MAVQMIQGLRQPALNSDMKDEQNRLKMNMPTVINRDLAMGVISAIVTSGVMSMAEAQRYTVVLPALALVSGAIGWHFFEVTRTNKALAERAADLLIRNGSIPKDVVQYISQNRAAWEAACAHPRIYRNLGNLWKIFCNSPQVAPEQFPFWDNVGRGVYKEDYFKKAIKTKRFDVAEYFLEKKFIKLTDIALGEIDMPKERKTKWVFTYVSLHELKSPDKEASLESTWDMAYQDFDLVKDTPLFKELMAILLDKEHESMIYRLFHRAIKDRNAKVMAFLKESGLHMEGFFNSQVNITEDWGMTLGDFMQITMDLKFKDTIDVKKLWQEACDFNYMNEAIYQVYIKLTPRAFAIEWDLSEAVAKGCSNVVDFFLKNKKIEVTDELAFTWWKSVGNLGTALRLKIYKVNPNARSKDGETPLLAVIDNPILNKFFPKAEHLKALLEAGASDKAEALARCQKLEREDLAKMFK